MSGDALHEKRIENDVYTYLDAGIYLRQAVSGDEDKNGHRWIDQIGPGFDRLLSQYGNALRRVGAFSNGEAFFQPVGGQQKGALGLGFSSKEGWI